MKPGELRKHRIVSSRAAENLFWAGRYGERAENNVRVCRLLLDTLEGADAGELFPTLAELAAQCGLIPAADTLVHSSPQALERALVAGLSETNRATSIGGNLADQARAAKFAIACRRITGARFSRRATISAMHSRILHRPRARATTIACC